MAHLAALLSYACFTRIYMHIPVILKSANYISLRPTKTLPNYLSQERRMQKCSLYTRLTDSLQDVDNSNKRTAQYEFTLYSEETLAVVQPREASR